APDSDSGIPRFESSYPSHIKKARFGELFAFLRIFNVECDVDTANLNLAHGSGQTSLEAHSGAVFPLTLTLTRGARGEGTVRTLL
ncbi:hypothetical protein, partial [Escherichia coli]|uniref:hypothetical protein n=4 Tax=Escherichia coli TaxID=562 RepID=UPI0019A263D5